MEGDEPGVAYEVAWVDNGSDDELTSRLAIGISGGAIPLEHIKLSPSNRGLAWGLNTLLF